MKWQMMINKTIATGADAVIVAMMKFCDPEEWDYPDALSKQSITH